MLSELFDPLDINLHLIFVKVFGLLVHIFYGQNKSKLLQNLFYGLTTTQSIKKQPPPPKKK